MSSKDCEVARDRLGTDEGLMRPGREPETNSRTSNALEGAGADRAEHGEAARTAAGSQMAQNTPEGLAA